MWNQIGWKFVPVSSYGPCHHHGHPQTSQIPFKIMKKHVVVKKTIFQFFAVFGAMKVTKVDSWKLSNPIFSWELGEVGRLLGPSCCRQSDGGGRIEIEIGTGQKRANRDQKTAEKQKNWVFHKNWFSIILNGIEEVWGCPGWPHGPYEHTNTNCHAIWSYMASEIPLFMIFGISM